MRRRNFVWTLQGTVFQMTRHTRDPLLLKIRIKHWIGFADFSGGIDAPKARDEGGLLSLQGRMTAQTIIKLILVLPVRLKHWILE